MWNNSVIIASTAGFLVNAVREMLTDIGFKAVIVRDDTELTQKIRFSYPRYLFIENCFMNNNTENYVYNIMKVYNKLHIVLWTAGELTAEDAARFIYAGAESFFSLREKWEKVDAVLKRFLSGKTYCPPDVEEVLSNEKRIPVFGEGLSERQIQILRLIDKKDRVIGEILSITLDTVNFHKKNIYKKLGIDNKNELVSYAVENKYIKSKR